MLIGEELQSRIDEPRVFPFAETEVHPNLTCQPSNRS